MGAFTGTAGLQRAGTLVACLMFALLAIGSGADRATYFNPAGADNVPGVFAVQAVIQQSRRELTVGNKALARVLAEKAVRLAPIDPASTALLGGSRLALGDTAGADKAFRVAGQMGWRAALTQIYWMDRAMATGDQRVAAMRLDALLRQDPTMVGERVLMGALESTEAGRAALVERLQAQPGWLSYYANPVDDIPAEASLARADVLNGLARRGQRLGCAGAGPLTRNLIAQGLTVPAYDFWLAHCPEHGPGLVADPSFAQLQVHQSNSPFEWAIVGDSDVSVNLEPGAAGRPNQLVIASSASFVRTVMVQMVMAQPGTYRLSWRALSSDGQVSNRVVANLSCTAKGPVWLPASLDQRSGRSFATARADGSCAGSWLSLALLPGTDSVTLDGIALEKIG